jgi:hypothetical protein
MIGCEYVAMGGISHRHDVDMVRQKETQKERKTQAQSWNEASCGKINENHQ